MSVDLPLFPSYLFVEIDGGGRARTVGVPGVVTLVGAGSEPWALPTAEIEQLRHGLHLQPAQPHPYLVTGQRIRIKSGPLAGLSGILVRKDDALRVVLSVDLFQQSIAVEVGVGDIGPFDALADRGTHAVS